MKLDQLAIKNFLGIREIALDLHGAAVHLFVGPNGAGKTSIREAVEWALTNRARGLEVKDAARLGHHGAEPFVQIMGRHAGAEIMVERSLTTGSALGALANRLGFKTAQALNAALFGGRLLDLDQEARQAALFLACGVEVTAETLKAAGVDDPEVIQTALHRSFASAATLATTRRREAQKIAEALGASAPTDAEIDWPEVGPRKLSSITKDEYQSLKAVITQLEAEHTTLAVQGNEVITVAREAVARASANFRSAESAVADARREADRYLDLPNCACQIKAGCRVHLDVPAARTMAEQNVGLEVQRFEAMGKALKAAEVALAEIRGKAMDAKNAELVALAQRIDGLRGAFSRVAEYRKAVNAVADIEGRRKSQEGLAKRYGAMETALAPGGLIAKLVAEPAEKFVGVAGTVAGYWKPTAHFASDLSWSFGEDGALPSTSEMWRTRCAAAVSVASVSGLKLLLLDEASTLFGQARGALVSGLLAAVNGGHLEQALVFASSHERPKPAPAALEGKLRVWYVEGGAVVPA